LPRPYGWESSNVPGRSRGAAATRRLGCKRPVTPGPTSRPRRGVDGTRQILHLLTKRHADRRLALCLLSGGGSAAMCPSSGRRHARRQAAGDPLCTLRGRPYNETECVANIYHNHKGRRDWRGMFRGRALFSLIIRLAVGDPTQCTAFGFRPGRTRRVWPTPGTSWRRRD